MADQVLPNLPDEIICKIIALLGEETFYCLGNFLWAGKRGYALVHEPSVLKMCVGTKIRTVDFRLNKETRKTLISQRSLWAVFRLEAFVTASFDKERTFCSFYEELGRYVATERALGRYVATEPRLELVHYVATERNGCSVAM
ncbi:hypothetical protein F2Q69_00027575 [Brassica cretica]|uniref:F-box domain-containing protein n=1 Tax=Brassica cretica TaxID=69181 RepID=A0A8S9S6U8_BRACR|nr:hypothetical protein F2Q69_00027575 [Brassica cretica]